MVEDSSTDSVALLLRTKNRPNSTVTYDAIQLKAGWHNTSSSAWGENRLSIQGKKDSTNWTEIMTLKANGQVGIGTDSPGASYKLDVNGNVKATKFIGDGSKLTNLSLGLTGLNLATTSGSVGIGLSNPDSDTKLHVNGRVRVGINSNESIEFDNGKVGIGTTNPEAQLSLGKWHSGSAGSSTDGATQLLLSGTHNAGVNKGTSKGTYKLKIEGYNNDGGAIIYPIYCQDENSKVDFWIRNRPSSSDEPTMYFAGNVSIGNLGNEKIDPKNKLEVDGTIMQKLDVIQCQNRGDWGSQNHPIKQYFRNKLSGKSVGTMMHALTNHPSWQGHYWTAWVDVNSKIQVIHNYYNKREIAE